MTLASLLWDLEFHNQGEMIRFNIRPSAEVLHSDVWADVAVVDGNRERQTEPLQPLGKDHARSPGGDNAKAFADGR